MSRLVPFSAAVALTAAVALAPVLAGGTAHASATVGAAPTAPTAHTAAAATYTVTKDLYFQATGLGPDHDKTCEIEGDLYVPTSASPTHRVPAILTTNGFGGSKNDQAADAETEAARGYVVLSYSGLGFGAPSPGTTSTDKGSGCQIEIDDPDWDGLAGKALISFLGGETGIGFRAYDSTTKTFSDPLPAFDDVIHDARDHDGVAQTYDPRVGMIGGSEGGEIQFSIAGVDPRLDMIIPEITWNDLAYSLGPNNATLPPHSVSYTTSGVLKLDWPVLFSAIGVADGIEGDAVNPANLTGTGTCPNFDPQVCVALATSAGLGYPPYDDAVGATSPTLDTVDFLRHRSVATYLPKIKIPVLLAQGQADTLFELAEAASTFHSLQAQGDTVHMIWQYWGHSDSTPMPGEDVLGDAGSPEGGMFQDWFDHYLKGTDAPLGPTFSYFRDYDYKAGATTLGGQEAAARASYASSNTFPVAPGVTYDLSGTDALVPAATTSATTSATRTTASNSAGNTAVAVVAGSSSFVAPVVAGTSYTETSAIDQSTPVTDVPGTFAAYSLPAFTKAVDIVGIPTATLHISAPTATSAAGPADELALFLRLEDVTPSGTVVLPHRLVAAFRAPDLTKPVTVQLPGIVHQVPAGDHLQLVVAGSDLAFRGNNIAQAVTISTGPGAAASTLTVPILGATTANPPATVHVATVTAPATTTVTSSPDTGELAMTGLDGVVPIVALAAVGGAVAARRLARRR